MNLMMHTVSHYSSNYSQDSSGGAVRQFALVASFSCFFQSDNSAINEQFGQRREQKQAKLFLTNSTKFDRLNTDDVIVYDSIKYRVMDKRDMCNLSRWYRVDLVEDISDIELVYSPIGGAEMGGTATVGVS